MWSYIISIMTYIIWFTSSSKFIWSNSTCSWSARFGIFCTYITIRFSITRTTIIYISYTIITIRIRTRRNWVIRSIWNNKTILNISTTNITFITRAWRKCRIIRIYLISCFIPEIIIKIFEIIHITTLISSNFWTTIKILNSIIFFWNIWT